MIDTVLIRYVARSFSRCCGITSFSAPISTEDLEQESALALHRGRKSIKGPMQDALKMARPRTRGGNQFHKAGKPKQIPLDAVYYRFRAPRPERAVLRSIDALQLLSRLDSREREIVHSLYWQGSSARELAARMGVTAPRVSQMKTEILRKLREQFK